MQFATANKLTYSAIEELLKLLQVLCPSPNELPTTLYRIRSNTVQGLSSNVFVASALHTLTKEKYVLPVLTKITSYVTLKVRLLLGVAGTNSN